MTPLLRDLVDLCLPDDSPLVYPAWLGAAALVSFLGCWCGAGETCERLSLDPAGQAVELALAFLAY